MAHVVGVPKRDSCQKCELPVFLAERMVVGKKTFHRTCMKCARCSSQLTPGNFYETEVDDEYCCETCPDEEFQFRNEELLKNHDYGNGSVAKRLAFFEKNESIPDAIEPKNISDEEKSKSLQRLGESATVSQSAFRMSEAFNDFLTSGENVVENSDEESLDASLTSTASPPSETPQLPLSPPPTEQRYTATAQLNLKLEQAQDNLEQTHEKPSTNNIQSNNIPYTLSTETTTTNEKDKMNNNGNDEPSNEIEYLEKLREAEKLIDLVENNITKDNTDNHNLAQISMKEDSSEEQSKEEAEKDTVEIRKMSKEDEATTERLSVVRARLQQFEVNNNSKEEEHGEQDNLSERTLICPSSTTLTNVATEIEKSLVEVSTTAKRTIVPLEIDLEEEIPKVPTEMKEEKIQTASLEMEVEEYTPEVPSVSLELESNEIKVPSITTTTAPLDLNLEEETAKVPTISLTTVPLEMAGELAVPSTIIKTTEEDEKTKELTEMELEDIEMPITVPLPENISAEIEEVEIRKTTVEAYPEDLNPFKSDDEDDEENKENQAEKKKDDLNPFDSSDDEIELEKLSKSSRPTSVGKVPPPRPPPPRISRNPFGEDEQFSRDSSLTSSINKRTPVPTPRTNISQSSTPEPTPRINQKLNATLLNSSTYSPNSLQHTHEYYGSATSLSVQSTPQHNISRNSDMRGSCVSLVSSAGGTTRSRKKTRAPLPPTLGSPTHAAKAAHKELFPSTETVNSSKSCSPSSSTLSSPKSARKKRLAPPPPKPARLETQIIETESKNSFNYPLQSESESKMCDEEKALLEGKGSQRRLIPLDASLLADEEFIECAQSQSQSDDLKQQQLNNEGAVVYRRLIQPFPIDTSAHIEQNVTGRQLEKLKDNKEAQNRNRQSQLAPMDDLDNLMSNLVLGYSNKSAQGKWKRRKGPAPALPVPPRKVLQMLPLQEIRHELDIIEVQQQGLEKQGVILEQMIRDRCEGGEQKGGDGDMPKSHNTKEVEDLILQLFELVNEKNELFRRQAELMYLRRQHRLEQEQADLEYEIRVLMAQPERNKTDTDKAREEALIARLVEVVQLRNDVIECLEMDRLREAEEDWSIKTTLEEHNAKREKHVEGHNKKSYMKLSKKEKKRQKEAKKLGKGSKKADADKDADDTELNEGQKHKNKKRKFSFLGNLVHT